MTSKQFKKYNIALCLIFLATFLRNSNAQDQSGLCEICTIVCKEVWWSESKLGACRNCLKFLCSNYTTTLANFFREHICVSAPHNQPSSTSGRNTGVSSLLLKTAIARARTCQVNSSDKADVLLVYQKTLNAWLEETRKPESLDLTRFVDSTAELPSLPQRQPTLRSGSSSQHICSSYGVFVSPKQVYHDKTGSIVEMFRFGTKKQLFYIRKCRKTRPIVTVSDTARCRTEIMLHLAYIKVETSQYRRNHKLYRHCVPHLNYYVCDDWIRLLGFCTLFIGG